MICSNNKTQCEDGICRSECPLYNGCPNDTPMMCPDGFCVMEIYECAGVAANCPLDNPFRCIDGTCVNQIYSCPRAKRTQVSTDYLIFVYPGQKLSLDIIYDNNNNIIGSIDIPANSFIITKSTNSSVIEIQPTPIIFRSVASQLIRKTISSFDLTRRADIYKVFPNADLENKQILQYEYTVLSAVLNISRLNTNFSNYNNSLILTLHYDFPVYIQDITNLINSTFNPFNDVCLGILDIKSSIWKCVIGKNSSEKYKNYEFKGEISSDGIYAVIFQPAPNINTILTEPNFLATYFMYILIGSGVALLALLIGFYVFWRVFRYRDKYKDQRKKEKKFEVQMTELANLGTTHMGQTLGDNMSHIFFTNNPSFKVVKVETKSIRETELENMMELLSKRLRLLENNSENLKSNHLNLTTELCRLKEYYSQ